MRTSTQKARAYGEIARRYQDLKSTGQRAYTAAYLEAVVISSLIKSFPRAGGGPGRRGNHQEPARGLPALSARPCCMADLNQSIRDEQTFFGYKPDYVRQSASSRLERSTRSRSSSPRPRTRWRWPPQGGVALASRRAFDTDAAAFQSELRQLALG